MRALRGIGIQAGQNGLENLIALRIETHDDHLIVIARGHHADEAIIVRDEPAKVEVRQNDVRSRDLSIGIERGDMSVAVHIIPANLEAAFS